MSKLNNILTSWKWLATVVAVITLSAAISGIQMGRADMGLVARSDFFASTLVNVVYGSIVVVLAILAATARQREDHLDVLYVLLVVLLPIAAGNAAWITTVYASTNSNALIEGTVSGSLALTLTAAPLSFYAGTRLNNRKPARQQQPQHQKPQHHQKPREPRDHQPRNEQ